MSTTRIPVALRPRARVTAFGAGHWQVLRQLMALLACACMMLLTPSLAQAAPPAFQEVLADATLLNQMRQGGLVLYLRHGATDTSRADSVSVNLADCDTQRALNAEGRVQAQQVGRALRQARIPVSEIWHSPMCRAAETARLAFPEFRGPVTAERQLMYTANLTSEDKIPVLAATRRLVSTPAANPASNRVIVAHAPNLADLMGYFVKPEGTVVVLRPLGAGKFEYLGSIPPAHWARLLTQEPR